ncbi:MAG: DinB family protein [Acidobacteriota bacterium]
MYSKDAIRFSLQLADQAMLPALSQVENAPLTFPTPNGGCHPLWTLGHLTFVEAMTHQLLAGDANPIEHWAPLFAPETVPTADPSQYPSFEEVRARYTQLRTRTLQLLDSFSEGDLDNRIANPPPGLEEPFATYGKALLTLSLHQMMHRGHLTDAIRAAGREVATPVAAAA